MKKVWTVHLNDWGCPENNELRGVYSTKKKAQDWCREQVREYVEEECEDAGCRVTNKLLDEAWEGQYYICESKVL